LHLVGRIFSEERFREIKSSNVGRSAGAYHETVIAKAAADVGAAAGGAAKPGDVGSAGGHHWSIATNFQIMT
jgi:hypothetical protein